MTFSSVHMRRFEENGERILETGAACAVGGNSFKPRRDDRGGDRALNSPSPPPASISPPRSPSTTR